MDELNEELRVLGLQASNTAAIPPLHAMVQKIEQLKLIDGHTAISQMPRELLVKIGNALDTTNGIFKIDTVKNTLFSNELAQLREMERNEKLLKDASVIVVKLLMAKSFWNERSEIGWSSVRTLIDNVKCQLDEQRGAAAAANQLG